MRIFLKRYNNLCIAYNVDSDAEKCERILDYCSRKVVHLIEALKSFTDKNWGSLETDLLRYYDADRKETRYIIRDLTQLTQDWKHHSIKTLTKWKSYERKFITIGGWLLAKRKISSSEQAAYFWKGINKTLRERIENRLAAESPPLSLTEAFPMAEVIKVVEKLFERNRFDYNLADSDSDLPDLDADTDTSEDESDSDESDKENHVKTNNKHRKTKKHTKHHSSDSDTEDDITIRASRKAHKATTKTTPAKDGKKHSATSKHAEQDDVEQIIKQLGKLSLDDPKYGLLYYRAIKLDTAVAQCVQPPVVNNRSTVNNNSYVQPTYSNTPPRPIQPRSPPVILQPPSARPPMTCFGCGEVGHGIRTCVPLQEMLQKGTLLRDQNGRITFRDGSVVHREQGETIIQAASKRKTMQSHFVTMVQDEALEYYQSEGEIGADVFAAEHQPKLINKTRKQVYDQVVGPSRKGKENVQPRPTPAQSARMPTRSGMGTRANPSRPDNSSQNNPKSTNKPQEFVSTPIDVRQPRKVTEPTSDEEMEDIQSPQVRTSDKPPVNRNRAPLRQSQVSAQVGETQVVSTILNTPVTMRLGEVLASSKELSDQLTDLIKRKNPRTAVVNHAVMAPKDAGRLIRIPLMLEDRKVLGIFDTGSELNVINRKIIRGLAETPINPKTKVTMNDANGGAGNLRGHISSVLLKCGNVETFANLFVGDTVPFDLLFGRPWQRDNLVSIDERADGTYLIFKDPQDISITYELLVEDHALKPNYPFDIHKAPEVNQVDYSVGMITAELNKPPNDNDSSVQEESEMCKHKAVQTSRVPMAWKQMSMKEILHIGNCLVYLRKRFQDQWSHMGNVIRPHVQQTRACNARERAHHIYDATAWNFGLSPVIVRPLDKYFIRWISKTNQWISLKWQQEMLPSQNNQQLSNQLEQRSYQSMANLNHPTNLPIIHHPLIIPANNFPLPPPADVSVLTLSEQDHTRQLDTLAFLRDGYLIGQEALYPAILSSPYATHFDQCIVEGAQVNHAVMYDASSIFINPYPNPPSVRTGNAYITFIEDSPPRSPTHNAPDNSPPSVPGADGNAPTRSNTPIEADVIDHNHDHSDPGPRPLQRTALGTVLPPGTTPDAFSRNRTQAPDATNSGKTVLGFDRCVSCSSNQEHTNELCAHSNVRVTPIYDSFDSSATASNDPPSRIIVEVTVAPGNEPPTFVTDPLVYTITSAPSPTSTAESSPTSSTNDSSSPRSTDANTFDINFQLEEDENGTPEPVDTTDTVQSCTVSSNASDTRSTPFVGENVDVTPLAERRADAVLERTAFSSSFDPQRRAATTVPITVVGHSSSQHQSLQPPTFDTNATPTRFHQPHSISDCLDDSRRTSINSRQLFYPRSPSAPCFSVRNSCTPSVGDQRILAWSKTEHF